MPHTLKRGAAPPSLPLRADVDAELAFIRRANRELAHWPSWTRVSVENLNLNLFDESGHHILETEATDGSHHEA